MVESMRERIFFQKSITVTDGNGNHMPEWSDFYSCRAYVNNLSGREYYAAAQTGAEKNLYFMVRYCSELKELDTKNYRIIFRDKPYNITFVDNVQYKNRTLKIHAEPEKG